MHHLQSTLHIIRFRQLAHTDGSGLGDRYLQTHLVFFEIDHEKFKLVTSHFLLFDRYDLTNAMSRIHNRLTGLETTTDCGFFLLG